MKASSVSCIFLYLSCTVLYLQKKIQSRAEVEVLLVSTGLKNVAMFGCVICFAKARALLRIWGPWCWNSPWLWWNPALSFPCDSWLSLLPGWPESLEEVGVQQHRIPHTCHGEPPGKPATRAQPEEASTATWLLAERKTSLQALPPFVLAVWVLLPETMLKVL